MYKLDAYYLFLITNVAYNLHLLFVLVDYIELLDCCIVDANFMRNKLKVSRYFS